MERDFTKTQFDRAPLIFREILPQPAGQEPIPKMALIGGEIQAAQIRPQTGDGAAKIARMAHEIVDETAGMSTSQKLLAARPIAPVFAQERLLFLESRAVVSIR